MSTSEIPLVPTPQTLSIPLSGVVYNLRVTWCKPATCWLLDVADVNNVPLLQGLPLVTGVNLLEQYAYAGLGGALTVQSDNDPDAVPTFSNLGVQGHLLYTTT